MFSVRGDDTNCTCPGDLVEITDVCLCAKYNQKNNECVCEEEGLTFKGDTGCRAAVCADDVNDDGKTLTLPNGECIDKTTCGTNPHTTVDGTTCICDTANVNGMDTW
jgi:hypothetical protein